MRGDEHARAVRVRSDVAPDLAHLNLRRRLARRVLPGRDALLGDHDDDRRGDRRHREPEHRRPPDAGRGEEGQRGQDRDAVAQVLPVAQRVGGRDVGLADRRLERVPGDRIEEQQRDEAEGVAAPCEHEQTGAGRTCGNCVSSLRDLVCQHCPVRVEQDDAALVA